LGRRSSTALEGSVLALKAVDEFGELVEPLDLGFNERLELGDVVGDLFTVKASQRVTRTAFRSRAKRQSGDRVKIAEQWRYTSLVDEPSTSPENPSVRVYSAASSSPPSPLYPV
jgi:hypothetical protein